MQTMLPSILPPHPCKNLSCVLANGCPQIFGSKYLDHSLCNFRQVSCNAKELIGLTNKNTICDDSHCPWYLQGFREALNRSFLAPIFSRVKYVSFASVALAMHTESSLDIQEEVYVVLHKVVKMSRACLALCSRESSHTAVLTLDTTFSCFPLFLIELTSTLYFSLS
jgi:hypothetical protein